ncbi:MAG: nuclear transport factor 2 family protein [Rhodanobacteraceae bacterium]|nr:MAG: nuclear transport factor 2 family protein [Rhodanobacteraceae bacterium]
MNRRWCCAAGLAATVCASAALAQSPAPGKGSPATTTAARAAIAQLERRWLAAVEPGGDREALDTILADDYLDTDWQGRTRDKAALVAAPAAQGVTQHVDGLRIRVWGDTAVATGVNHIHSAAKGWTVTVPFTDVFACIDGHWRAVASQETLRKPANATKSN